MRMMSPMPELEDLRTPTQARAHKTRAALVEAAQAEFAESGYAGTTAKSIAKRAGVSTGSFYQYFTDKGKYPYSLQALVDEQYLRAIPVDPITKSSDTWQEIRESLTEESLETGRELGIIDVQSGSKEKALDGTPFSTW